MLKLGMKIAAAALLAASALAASAHAQDAKKTFYLLSHGGPSDAFWLDWNAGATKACEQLNVTCNISFSGGDMAVQKEAFNSAIAAKPDGIGTTSAQPGLWTAEVKAAKEAGIPIVFFNTDDPATGRQAYVGADLRQAGVTWAKYLVDNKLVKEGDKVFLPVEVPGASYQQLETEGIASVFDPLKITYDVVDCGTDPAGIIAKMSDYMLANNPPAVIALGDSVAAAVRKVFDNGGIKPRLQSRWSAGAIRRTRRKRSATAMSTPPPGSSRRRRASCRWRCSISPHPASRSATTSRRSASTTSRASIRS